MVSVIDFEMTVSHQKFFVDTVEFIRDLGSNMTRIKVQET